MQEMNNTNIEDVVVEVTEDVVTKTNGGFLKKALAVGGTALGVYLIVKGVKKAKAWNDGRKAKKEAKKATKKGTFHSEIFDEDVEVSEEEVTE